MFKYIGIRLLALIAVVFLTNQLYIHTFWKEDIRLHGDILENLWNVDPDSDAIYLGESSNFNQPEFESVGYRISYILDDLLPEIKVATVDHSGLHAGTYLSVIKNIDQNSSVKLLIVTMNLRSFDATWRYAPFETYLSKTERMLSPYPPLINRFLVALKCYDHKTDPEREAQFLEAWDTETFDIPDFKYHNVSDWDSAMAWHEWLDVNPNLDTSNIGLACHYIKNFAFQIDTLSNERIADFDGIMEEAEKRGYIVVFNLLAENMAEAKKLVGDDLIYLMEYNRKLLIDRYERKGAIVVDNLYAVPDSCFADRNWPTEHYSKYGKTIIAENLNKAIRAHKLLQTFSTETE